MIRHEAFNGIKRILAIKETDAKSDFHPEDAQI